MADTSIKKVPKFKFSEFSIKTIDALLESYGKALKELEKLCKKPEDFIVDAFGVCNKNYKMRYITPSNVSTFVSYVAKAVNEHPFPIDNVSDLETLSVAMLQRFVNDNERCIPFEDTNAYGANANFDQREITLGKLSIMCANEFYDRDVYSKADMINRAKSMENDLKLLSDMDFDKKVKKMMVAIPGILDENCPALYENKMRRLIADALTRGIQTICVVNLCTIEQMIAYCVPNKAFNIVKNLKSGSKRLDYDFYDESVIVHDVDEEEIIEEAVDPTKVKPVFINLSEGGKNFISKTIKGASGGEYSHSSIGFDIQLNKLYTFNMVPYHDDIYHWQKAGFQYEALRSSKYNNTRCTVYCALVPIEVFNKMKKAADDIANSKAKYDYKACIDKLKALSSIDDKNPPRTDNKKKQICSSFVNNLLSIAGKPLSDNEIATPSELGESAKIKSKQFFCVYDGPGSGYDPKLAQEKIDDFIKQPSSKMYSDDEDVVKESFTDFYTECCILKTNDLRIRSRIPFNCNIRDIVLQDLHPVFKDTESAIMFMISDERSPITGLLRKYRTVDKVQPNYRILNMFMHIKPYESILDASKDPYFKQNELGMHTDPNWLDKITYGNSFLDGNYRSDAVGNNKFSPIEQALDHLYSMYCPCGLKTNEQLANHIVEVSNVMIGIINQFKSRDCCVENWDMVRDILAVFGEILTRTMLKLYDNNSIIFTISDTMDDAAAPGYMYEESFDIDDDEDEEVTMEAGPSISVQKTNKTGLAKLGGNISNLIKKFIDWVSNKFLKSPENFVNTYQDQIKFVNDNKDLNSKIKTALDADFVVNLNNFNKYNVKADTINNINLEEIFNEILQTSGIADKNGNISDNATTSQSKGDKAPIKSFTTESVLRQLADKIGISDTIKAIAPGQTSSAKEIGNDIINALLHAADSEGNPVQGTAQQTRLTGDIWENDIVGIITNTGKLMEIYVNGIGKQIKNIGTKISEAAKAVTASDKKGNADETINQIDQANKNNAATSSTNSDATIAYNALMGVNTFFTTPMITAIENMFKENYKLYADVTRAFNSQYDQNAQPAAQNVSVQ